MNIEKVTQLPEDFQGINPHNLYLYSKADLANLRAGTAHTKTRSDVKGGGKKPWRQKGTGRARAGSITSPVFVGGGVAHGPKNTRNWSQKINKKQQRIALKYALNEKAENESLFRVDTIRIESAKTKDAVEFIDRFEDRKNYLIVVDTIEEKTYLAFRNIPYVDMIEADELNAYDVAVYDSVIFEKTAYEKVIKG